jgi:hypothetical protein
MVDEIPYLCEFYVNYSVFRGKNKIFPWAYNIIMKFQVMCVSFENLHNRFQWYLQLLLLL